MEEDREKTKIAENKACESGQKNSSGVFCEGSGTYLCRDCVDDHTVKYRKLEDSMAPYCTKSTDVKGSGLAGETEELQDGAQKAFLARSKLENGDFGEAIELCEAAHCSLTDDASIASNLSNWGLALVKKENYGQEEVKYAAANSIYSRLFSSCAILTNYEVKNESVVAECVLPGAIYPDISSNNVCAAKYLSSWGVALAGLKNYEKAAILFAAADAILNQLVPDDFLTAHNLSEWGLVLSKMKMDAEAVVKYAAADAIYSRFHPDNFFTFDNMERWGNALSKMKMNAEAAKKYAAVGAFYSRSFPDDGDTASELIESGTTYLEWTSFGCEWGWGLVRFAIAYSIDSRICPDSIATGTSLSCWGDALTKVGVYPEAVAKFEAADTIFSRSCPRSTTRGCNLETLGYTLSEMGRKTEAVQKLEMARAIFIVKGWAHSTAKIDLRINQLQVG